MLVYSIGAVIVHFIKRGIMQSSSVNFSSKDFEIKFMDWII